MASEVLPRRLSETIPGGVRYRIPGRRYWAAIPFAAWAMFIFGWGGYGLVPEVIHDDSFLWPLGIVFLIFWIAIGLYMLYRSIDLLFGVEIVTLTPGRLAVQRRILGFEPEREFNLRYVQNLRTAASPSGPTWGVLFQPGLIAFEYGGRTRQFGAGLQPHEAAALIADLEAY